MVRLALFQGKAAAPLPMWRRTHNPAMGQR
jgi:hypothetical protein